MCDTCPQFVKLITVSMECHISKRATIRRTFNMSLYEICFYTLQNFVPRGQQALGSLVCNAAARESSYDTGGTDSKLPPNGSLPIWMGISQDFKRFS